MTRVPYEALDARNVDFDPETQSRVWASIYRSLPVKPYQPAHYGGERRPVVTFRVAEVLREVKQAYSSASTAYGDFGSEASAAALSDALAAALAVWARPTGGARNTALDEAVAFYRRPSSPRSDPRNDGECDDFHSTTVQLSDQPLLLRALGLLMDFELPITALGQAGSKELSVQPHWASNPPPGWIASAGSDVSPSTAYTLVGARFCPRSANDDRPPIGGGVLQLDTMHPRIADSARFSALTVDVDAAALRIVAAKDNQEQSLPTLRSNGFSLIDHFRADELQQRLRSEVSQRDITGRPLYAEDLVGGYRLDIRAERHGWRSTAQRRTTYTVDGSTLIEKFLDEGFVRPDGLTTGDAPTDPLYVHEVVARWDGFSTVVQRPGRPIPSDRSTTERPARSAVRTMTDVERGSLPRLLFGREYRLRVRIADLAGEGVRLGDTTSEDDQHSIAVTHRRFEPLPPPEIIAAKPYTMGEASDTIIVDERRSATSRHLLISPASLELALQYDGTFDQVMSASASDLKVDEAFTVAQRADRSASDIPGADVHGSGAEQYVFVASADVEAPWLPDPGARSLLIWKGSRPDDLAGVQGLPCRINWDEPRPATSWPHVAAITLVVEAAASGCVVEKTTSTNGRSTVRVKLGPSELITLRLANCPNTHDDVKHYGIHQWTAESGRGDLNTADGVINGLNPLITTWKDLTLAHAVRRPARDPSGNLEPGERKPSSTSCTLSTRGLRFDVASTGRAEIRAKWDHIDEDLGTQTTTRTAILGIHAIDRAQSPSLQTTLAHELGDTRRHIVTYTVTAHSRFVDCYPSATQADLEKITTSTEFTHEVRSTVRPPTPRVSHCVPGFRWSRHQTGNAVTSTRYGSRLRIYLHPPWYVTGAREELAVLVRGPYDSGQDSEASWLSLIGQDPIWPEATLPETMLRAEHFDSPSMYTVALAPGNHRKIVTYTAEFDAALKRWFVDIDLSKYANRSAYRPFVRLALARYQRLTTPDPALTSPEATSLSEVIYPEPLQLLPDRTLTAQPVNGANQITLTLDGLVPKPSDARRPNTIAALLQVYEGSAPPTEVDSALIGTSGWITAVRAVGEVGQPMRLEVPQTSRPRRIVVTEAESYTPPADPNELASGAPESLMFAECLEIDTNGNLATPRP